VRTGGEPDADVRLLVDDGERFLSAAVELATNLRRDVYLTAHGAFVRFERESSPVTGDSWEAVAVDRGTGEPAPWLVVRPADLPATVPTWFASIRGRLRRATGLVTLPLPDGIAFATRSSFGHLAQVVSRVAPPASGLTTIAVNADLGRFEIGRFNDAGSLLGGVDFATLVAASLDELRPDVQLALSWPPKADARAALDDELVRFADALDRTVWVPEPGGSAVLDGARSRPTGHFAAVDRRGEPCHWWPYQSRLTANYRPARPGCDRPRYTTDGAGRLVPALIGQPATQPIGWLPATPVVNPTEIDLYVWTPTAVAGADGGWVVPTADLFVLASQDPDRLAARTRTGHLLRLRAGAATAVDLLEHAPAAPAEVQRRILDLGATRLLPLSPAAAAPTVEAYVTGRFDLDGNGAIATRTDVPPAPLTVRFDGAEHGVAGLPNEVVGWPEVDQRADLPAYLVLPGAARDGFVALTRTRPEPAAGQQVLEVKVRRRRMIDVAATVARLAERGLHNLVAFAGVDLALPTGDAGRAVVTKVWSYVDDQPVLCKLDRGTLADHLTASPRITGTEKFIQQELFARDLAGVR
jgi:hypothetical protein